MKKHLFCLITYLLLCKINAFDLNLYTDPQLIACAEISLISDTPATSYYQPAKRNNGLSISHSFPFGLNEVNLIHLSFQSAVKHYQISAGTYVIHNEFIKNNIFYTGFSRKFYDISLGTNFKYFQQSVQDYNQLNAYSLNLGVFWENKIFTHGLTYNNLTNSKTRNIKIPNIFKYECMISGSDRINFALSFEKEKHFDFRYAFAVKTVIHPVLNVFSGFISNPDQYSAGLEIFISKISVNYAIRTHRDLDYTHAMGIYYKF